MSKIIIISNRLPIKLTYENEELSLQVSEGGLATGLGSIYKDGNNIWVGWPGLEISEEQEKEQVTQLLKKENLLPVFLDDDEIQNYYEGFSNETLWPVFHYMSTYAQFEQRYWDYYQQVNEKFKEAVLTIAEPNDIIWVHDYQLLLLPLLIRDSLPDISIGFFQHIPFPSYEIFRLIPWRKEIIRGMLGADLLGFHTYDDVRHFLSSATRLLHVPGQANKILKKGREIAIDAFPMGIDAKKYEDLAHCPAVKAEYEELNKSYKDLKIILSIDRLDYSKGIIPRLSALEMILANHPEYIEKIMLVMIVVPSRDTIPKYKELKDEIDKLVGNLNARFRTAHWNPIQYFYRSFPIESLSALYSRADICLVTPMRDGMNLVSKEYIASRKAYNGVLILSEMAGASKELAEALIINPNSIGEVYNAILEALTMPEEEQASRMKALSRTVKKFDIHHWVKIFMNQLSQIKESQTINKTKSVNEDFIKTIRERKSKAEKSVLFLDYDGTLVGFNADIDKAMPDKDLYNLLEALSNDKTRIVIISGRKHETLEEWFGHLDIDIIAEHGAWIKANDLDWQTIPGLTDSWKNTVRPILEAYSDRTPGSVIEEKHYSLAWHYRKTEKGLGELRANELENHLSYLTREIGLQILAGSKVLEIKNFEVNKGKAALSYLANKDIDFVLAIGDDHTDEDIFTNLADDAITIKVGNNVTAADYYIKGVEEVRDFLKRLV